MRLTTLCTLIVPLFFGLHISLLPKEVVSLELSFIAALGLIPAAVAMRQVFKDIDNARQFSLAAFAIILGGFAMATFSLSLMHASSVVAAMDVVWAQMPSHSFFAGITATFAALTVVYLRKSDV